MAIGMELLGRDFDEATLISIAYGYEQTVAGTSLARQAPTFTPELGTPAPAPVPLMPLRAEPALN